LRKHERTLYLQLKASLALVDIMLGLFLMKWGLESVWQNYYHQQTSNSERMRLEDISFLKRPLRTICHTMDDLPFTCMVISYFHLIMMSIQRCRAIVNPIQYSTSPTNRPRLCILSLWATGIGIAALIAVKRRIDHQSDYDIVALHFCINVVPYLIALSTTIAMCVSYTRHQVNVNRSRGTSQHQIVTLSTIGGGSTISRRSVSYERRKNQHYRFVKNITFLMSGYSVLNVPWIGYMIYVLTLPSTSEHVYLYQWLRILRVGEVLSLLAWTNGIVDFVVYSSFDHKFQSHVKSIFQKVAFQLKTL